MGSKERRSRQQQERQQQILEAAYALACEAGNWRKLTLRMIAERIEYTHPTIYESFASKEAILVGLLRVGFARLCSALEQAQQHSDGPEARLYAIADAYWSFAFAEPVLYDLMLTLEGVPFGSEATPPEARAAFALLRKQVAAVLDERVVADLDGEVDIFWSTLHGLIALTLSGRMALGQERAAQLLRRAVADLLRAWKVDR